jgi:hypothetical protein
LELVEMEVCLPTCVCVAEAFDAAV